MQTSEQIIQVIDKLCEKFGIAIDWTSNNILPYIQQLGDKIVKYDLYTSIVWLIMGLILVVLGGYIIYKSINFTNKKDYLDLFSAKTWMRIIGVSIILLSVFIFVVPQIMDIIQDLVFPEKTIMEFIKPYLN